MKTAFLFPGQGAQNVGMGRDVADAHAAAADIFNRANEILGYEISKICFEGPDEKLNSTVYSQPAIFTVSAAILEVIKTRAEHIKADVAAGLSLGEYSAIYAAGLISFEDGLKLVQTRGQAMQAAADATEGSMVSIIGLDDEKVRQLCTEAGQGQLLEPVNFNCPGQIVVSGEKAACKRAAEIAEKFGAIKAVELAVAGAFHTAMMKSAAETLEEALNNTRIDEPGSVKILANITGDYYESADHIRQGLVEQLTQPILWQKCMEKLLAEGVADYYEIGPGRVLTGLMKRIHRKTKVNNVSGLQNIEKLLTS